MIKTTLTMPEPTLSRQMKTQLMEIRVSRTHHSLTTQERDLTGQNDLGKAHFASDCRCSRDKVRVFFAHLLVVSMQELEADPQALALVLLLRDLLGRERLLDGSVQEIPFPAPATKQFVTHLAFQAGYMLRVWEVETETKDEEGKVPDIAQA